MASSSYRSTLEHFSRTLTGKFYREYWEWSRFSYFTLYSCSCSSNCASSTRPSRTWLNPKTKLCWCSSSRWRSCLSTRRFLRWWCSCCTSLAEVSAAGRITKQTKIDTSLMRWNTTRQTWRGCPSRPFHSSSWLSVSVDYSLRTTSIGILWCTHSITSKWSISFTRSLPSIPTKTRRKKSLFSLGKRGHQFSWCLPSKSACMCQKEQTNSQSPSCCFYSIF